MSKTTYMYGQEAQGAIKEREPYWDYMARRGAGKSSEVYPVREDVPADLWGKPVAKDPDKWAYENKIRVDASVNKNEALSKDMVNHPSHYNKGIETSEYIKSWEMNWNQANVVKYVTRYNLKSKDINIQIQDLMKAKWYLEDLIKELEEHNPY
mgnify:CR=1 FL=1